MNIPVQHLSFPLFFKWYITGKCNLRCTHCYLTDYSQQADYKTICNILSYSKSKGVIHISYLGGEPFSRSDMPSILKYTSAEGIRSKVATNGTLLDLELARDVCGIEGVSFQISLEGHSPELSDPVRGEGAFQRALVGLQNIKLAGGWCSISITISSQNYMSIEQLVKLASEAGADSIKLAAFVPVGTGSQKAQHLMLDEDALSYIRSSLPSLRKIYSKIHFDTAFLPRSNASYSSNCGTFGCGAGTNSLVINNDLTISACDILTEEDRTKEKIQVPEDIERLWRHSLFEKWRGVSEGATLSIPSFKGVHQHGCHVATTLYGKNILND